jgi:uncharacterized phiE125 gp8 family phage protein
MSLTQAKAHLRINDDQTDEDDLIEALITAVRKAAESFTGISICSKTFADYYTDFPAYMTLYYGNVSSVSAVQYYDGANAQQTLSSAYYNVDGVEGRAVIRLNDGYTWPDVYANRHDGVIVTYTAGYSTSAAIPEDLVWGMKLTLSRFYEQREDVGGARSFVPSRAESLMHPYRVYDER